MKKSVFIILSILLIISITICLYINNARRLANLAQKNNKEYEQYYEQEILGTTLISLINKTMNYNNKNNIQKQEDTIYYKNNDTNSIQITIKFLESDKIINMEDIAEKQSESFIKFFATSSFKCTNIEYHKKTNNIQSMHFEQINN